MTTAYYTLAIYNIEHNKWYAEFGDYDKELVRDEMNYHTEGYEAILMNNMKIVKTNHDQQSIDAAINKLNGSK